jgi:hypothetical protein
MNPHQPVRRACVAVAAVALLLAGCGLFRSALSTSELERRTAELLDALPVEPLGGPDGDLTVTEVKLDGPYVSAHGLGRPTTIDEMRTAVTAQLEADGYQIHSSQPVAHSLGYEILAADGAAVVRAQLGTGDPDSTTYRPLEDGVYVVVQTANVDSGPDWTDVGP